MSTPKTLTGDDSIKTWLDHPVGGPIIRDLLAQAGQNPDVLKPVQRLAIKRLVKLSKGQFSQQMVDDLVARAAAGEVPAGAADAAAAAPEPTTESADASAPAVEIPEWVERLDQGRFAGKTVIVTGAGSGIGRATASRIAREGGRVWPSTCRRSASTSSRREHAGADIVTLVADITDDAKVAEIVAAAGGRIDGLANIAGIMDDMTPIGELTDAVWKRVFSVNVDGTMKLMRAVVPTMLAQGYGLDRQHRLRGGAARLGRGRGLHGVEARRGRPHEVDRVHVRPERPARERRGPRPDHHEHRGDASRRRSAPSACSSAMAILPDAAEAEALAASITFLLSDDGVNINGVVLASDGGWSAT